MSKQQMHGKRRGGKVAHATWKDDNTLTDTWGWMWGEFRRLTKMELRALEDEAKWEQVAARAS